MPVFHSASAALIALDLRFPARSIQLLACTQAFHRLADTAEIDLDALAVIDDGSRPFRGDAQPACFFHRVHIGAQKQEFPAMAFLFLFDQPLQDPIQLKLAADYLSEEYPFLKGFLDDAVTKAEAQLSQHPDGTLVEWFAYGFQYAIHLFILRRFGWLIAGWIVVLCLVGWLTRRESPKATMAPRRNIR